MRKFCLWDIKHHISEAVRVGGAGAPPSLDPLVLKYTEGTFPRRYSLLNYKIMQIGVMIS